MTNTEAAPMPSQRELFGHPIGLYVLFFTEMWERFSYYGMRAILTLYMITSVAGKNPGLGWDETFALSIYGWYTMLVYVMSIPGGILADKFIGQKKAVMLGGFILVAGHGILAIDAIWAFYLGLGLIILGVGCLKPNISTMVGGLYPGKDPRRDQGFTIFYIGINIGAFLSALIVGFIGEVYGWHYGFGLAGIGMAIGQVVFILGRKYLQGVGEAPGKGKIFGQKEEEEDSSLGRLFAHLLRSPLQLGVTLALAAGAVFLSWSFASGGERIAWSALGVFLALVFGMLSMVYQEIGRVEKDRFVVLLLSFLIVIVFWGAYEQAGGLMNIYTLQKIDRVVGLLSLDIVFFGASALLLIKGGADFIRVRDTRYIFLPLGILLPALYLWLRSTELSNPYEIPAAVFQSLSALYIVIVGTAVGGFWIWWRRQGREASSLFKMAIGTIIMGAGFLFMAKASADIEQYGDKAALILLLLAYLLHVLGELCASPVALSFITKVAPVKYVSIMMGVYFAATGFGSKLAGLIGEFSRVEPVEVEARATGGNLNAYQINTADWDTLREMEIVGAIKWEEGEVKLTKAGQNMWSLLEIDEENLHLLRQMLEKAPGEGELTAVLELSRENTTAPFTGELEIFELQDQREYRTFLSIFLFTTLFGLLLLLFLKRLKRLTHGAEEHPSTHFEEQEGYELADRDGA